MIWLVFAFLTVLALASILWPLLRAKPGVQPVESEVAFFSAQAEEISRDVERGLMTAEDAALAKAEAARRLIHVAEAEGPGLARSHAARVAAAILSLMIVPGVAFGIYVLVGNPGVPDQPLLARLNASPEKMDVNAALAQIERHLAQNPDDARGYELVAPVYMRVGRPADAARAMASIIRLTGGSAEKYDAMGQALVYAANGKVTAEAEQAFRQAAAAAPDMAQPQFYLGIAAEQRGDSETARSIWTRLLASAPPNAPWAEMVRSRLAALGGAGPNSDAGRAVAALPAEQQQAAIRNMVEGLAARLSQNGHDLEGWLRLVRAFTVLNEKDRAAVALADARRNFASDPAGLAQLDALARELGLGG